MIFLAGHTDLVLASVPPIPVAAWHPSSMPADETPDQSPRCHFPRNQVVPDVQSKSVGQEKETRPKEIDQKLRSVLEAWIYGCCGMPRDLTAGNFEALTYMKKEFGTDSLGQRQSTKFSSSRSDSQLQIFPETPTQCIECYFCFGCLARHSASSKLRLES